MYLVSRFFHIPTTLHFPTPLSVSAFAAMMWANKSLMILSCAAALVPTGIAAAILNEQYAKAIRRKQKETDEALENFHKYSQEHVFETMKPKAGAGFIEAKDWKGPSRKPGNHPLHKGDDE
jgi:hypothetical protein